MAIGLNRSQMLLVEVNNYTFGETRVWIREKEIPLEKFCGLVLEIFKDKARQFSWGRQFLERLRQLGIAPGFYNLYTERLALPKELPALEDLLRDPKPEYAVCPISVEGFDIDFYDFTIFAEYFLTNSNLMSRRDPRLALLKNLKAI